MAAALLIGTNAWAQNTISLKYYGGAKADQTFATLQEAIDYVNPGDSATITLSANQTLENGILIPHVTSVATDADKIVNRAGQRICIDLGGKTIKMTAGKNHTLFSLLKGTLHFTGKGTIKREADRNKGNVFQRCAIAVTGTDANKNDATKDRSKQVWSTLYVDKDVTVIGHGDDCFGIGINEIESESVYPRFADYQTSFLGYTTKQSHGTGNMWDPTTSGAQYSAFGVRVFINGTVDGTVRGVNVCGNINQTPGIVEGATDRKPAYPYYDHYFPYIKIGKDAEVYCEPYGISDNGNGGIYLGGWAIVDIEGAVHGQTGVMVKAGDVLVQDGSVYSDCPSASFTGNYHGTVEGSGIFVASSASYAGESSVTVAGDSYIAGNGGCAIVDICATSTKEQTNTAVTHIDITGGTIVAGETGAISLGTNTSNVTDITGGVVEGKVDIGDASDESQRFHTDVTNLLPNTDNYHTTVIKDEGGKQTIVISQGETPATEPGQETTPWSWCADDAQTGKNVAWTKKEDAEIPQNKTITLGELQIVSGTGEGAGARQQLTINSGAILQVDHLVMNDYARIIVEAGGKLIVKGAQGIVAPKAENIVLKYDSQNKTYATFLFNPAVSSNRHPNATVEFTTNSWWVSNEGENYQWEWFGIPTYNQAQAISSKAGNDAVYASVEVFENDTWTDLGYIGGAYDNNPAVLAKLDKPFNAYNLMAYRGPSAAAPTITISGELVGNMNAPLNANMKWNTFANSYTAEIDAPALINYLAQHSQNIDPIIWVAENSGNSSITWGAKEADDIESLKPMQAFLLRNANYVETTAINYADMVYGFSGNNAPRRDRIASDNTAKICVNVANENGTWDDVVLRENVNTRIVEKYLNRDINIYIVDGEKNDIVAYEDLENTYVGFSTVKGGNFTISFTKAEGREFDLIDLETGARFAASEGETYSFSAAANYANDYRFKLVERAKMPTAIENTEVKANVKGIYTITGQFLGEMNVWNTLPAGVYVVNGAKLVK